MPLLKGSFMLLFKENYAALLCFIFENKITFLPFSDFFLPGTPVRPILHVMPSYFVMLGFGEKFLHEMLILL